MPVGPRPLNSTPRTYKNNGITVIGPANNINNDNPGLLNEKSLKPFLINKIK